MQKSRLTSIPREEGDEYSDWDADVLQEVCEGGQAGDLLLQQGEKAVDGQQQKTLQENAAFLNVLPIKFNSHDLMYLEGEGLQDGPLVLQHVVGEEAASVGRVGKFHSCSDHGGEFISIMCSM